MKEQVVKSTKIESIGDEIASMYGGYCTKVTKIGDTYRFYCVDHGDKFYIDIKEEDIN